MKFSLKLPMFGMNMDEATIVGWRKRPGERFTKGEALYEIETEKVTTEVEAPCDGVLLEIFVDAGRTARVGDPVCSADTAT
ncbi:MAG: lipoyl domain-containing protein [Burkholderiales bacterium]